MMSISSLVSTLFMFSVLIPTKLWFAPHQPISINIDSKESIKLVLTDFQGKVQTEVPVEQSGPLDIRPLFPSLKTSSGILYAVPKDKDISAFTGTPLVIQTRMEKRTGAPAGQLVTRVEPLRYIEMETSEGKMTMAFYYDSAPNTVSNFLTLGEEGYFDGMLFHRIIKNFVVQGGDPLSADPERAGTGGPGFTINQEFNDRQHVKGILSMARQGDPLEQQGMMPRYEAANSASSQFFICLDYSRTKALDGKYTVFGKVVEGLDTLDKLGSTPTAAGDRPTNPVEIKKVTVKTVTPENNPYFKLFAEQK